VIYDRGRPRSVTPKVFHFRTDRKNVAALKAASIDAVSLANNHALDYEYEAMFDTLAALDREGIRHAGAGHDSFRGLGADACVCRRPADRPLMILIQSRRPERPPRSAVRA
jgi:poly-gamma-glutamate synthesis protein (capsule biosynthesis protein)